MANKRSSPPKDLPDDITVLKTQCIMAESYHPGFERFLSNGWFMMLDIMPMFSTHYFIRTDEGFKELDRLIEKQGQTHIGYAHSGAIGILGRDTWDLP